MNYSVGSLSMLSRVHRNIIKCTIDRGQEGQQFSRERSMTCLGLSCTCVQKWRAYTPIWSSRRAENLEDLLLVLGLRLPRAVTESNARAAAFGDGQQPSRAVCAASEFF